MRHEKKPFKEAFQDFLFSGSTGRTLLIMLLVLCCAVGAVYMVADLLG